jgi:hypothetical protein
LAENLLRKSWYHQQLFAFFSVINGVVVDNVKKSFNPGLFVFSSFEN